MWNINDVVHSCDAGSIPATSTAPSVSNLQVRAPLARGSARARTRSGPTRTRAHRSRPDHNGVVRPPAVVKGRPHAAEPGVARHVVRSTPAQSQPLVTEANRRRKRRCPAPVDGAVLAAERVHEQASERGSCPARPQLHEPADYRLSLRDSVPCSLSDASPGRHPERRIRADGAGRVATQDGPFGASQLPALMCMLCAWPG